MNASPLIAGMGLGLTVAVPIGPIATICVQRTLCAGRAAGIATGLGASTVHTIFGAAALYGISSVGRMLEQSICNLHLLSAALLIWMSFRFYRQPPPTLTTAVIDRRSFGTIYFSTLVYGLTNPLTVILFMSCLPALGTLSSEFAASILIGIFSGSMLWWIMLTNLVAQVRGPILRYLAPWTGKIAALILVAMAYFLLHRALALA